MEALELARDVAGHPAGTPIEILDTLPTGWTYIQTLDGEHVTDVIVVRPEDIRRAETPTAERDITHSPES